MVRPGPYEAYALSTGRLHHNAQAQLMPFFPPWLWQHVHIRIVMDPWGRHAETLGWRGVLVIRSTIYVLPGILDLEGPHHRVTWGWTTPEGLANWAHELKHVEQWCMHPWRLLWQWGWGFLRSLRQGRWYIHTYFPYEQEAIAFEAIVRARLRAAQ